MRSRVVVGAVAICCFVAMAAGADDLQWAVDAELASAFVWRGQVVTDEAVLQPAVTAAFGDFSINLWANLDLTDGNDRRGDITEIDFTASYAGESEYFSWEAGVISYLFTDAAGDTWEVFLSATLDMSLEPSFSVYYDFDQIDGFYATVGIGHGIVLGDRSDLELALNTGWGSSAYHRGYLGVHESTLADGLASAAVAVGLSDRTSLSFNLSYSWLWDSAIRSAARGAYGEHDLLFASIGLSIGL